MKKLKIFILFIFVLSLLGSYESASEVYNKSMEIKTSTGENYNLQWTVANETLMLKLSSDVSGWLAIGFPRKPGKMIDCDAVIGWIDSTYVFAITY